MKQRNERGARNRLEQAARDFLKMQNCNLSNGFDGSIVHSFVQISRTRERERERERENGGEKNVCFQSKLLFNLEIDVIHFPMNRSGSLLANRTNDKKRNGSCVWFSNRKKMDERDEFRVKEYEGKKTKESRRIFQRDFEIA